MNEEIELRRAWDAVARRGDPAARRRAESVFADVVNRYRQPHRHYHSVRHLLWVVRHAHELAEVVDGVDLRVVLAAAFFHDAIYEPAASDNEERSAVLAHNQLDAIGWPEADRDAVCAYVRATAAHVQQPDLDVASDATARGCAVLLDADLAILGTEPAAYSAYATGVRREYGHLDDAAWCRGRGTILRRLLDRPALYVTAPARDWWEARARANLTSELASLSDGGADPAAPAPG